MWSLAPRATFLIPIDTAPEQFGPAVQVARLREHKNLVQKPKVSRTANPRMFSSVFFAFAPRL